MTSSNRKIGVLGVGFGSAVHIPGFRSEGWDVVALYSRNEERARAAAEVNGVPDFHTDAQELIGRDDLDAVAIATPPGPHHEFALAALRAGKHVLCEKPFAMNVTEAKAMRDAAAAKGVTAMVAHEFRYTPQRLHAKDLIAQGYVGEPRTIYAQANFSLGRPGAPMTWQADLAQGGGALGALGSHFLDSFRWWVGDITAVSAHLATLRPDRTDP
ncbi:MAG: Gfo/Idh/MocA family oxidoreductase, partial [Chloroflexi bacterium]|nr:Gfo/Idh/MocA family oxidoreductase [Chloroflexota bacterium]